MCGILGIIIKNKNELGEKAVRKSADILFKLSESRGKEAAGMAIKNSEEIRFIKSPVNASHLIKSPVYKELFKDIFKDSSPELALTGHSRLATHGTEDLHINNQPVIKDGIMGIHNGIIANDKEIWQKFPDIKRKYEIDTEVFLALAKKFLDESKNIAFAIKKTFEEIEGSASVALMFDNSSQIVLATNTGSLYKLKNSDGSVFLFASENYILEEFINKNKNIDGLRKENISQLKPGKAIVLDTKTLNAEEFDFNDEKEIVFKERSLAEMTDATPSNFKKNRKKISDNRHILTAETKNAMTETWQRLYEGGGVERCAKCLLPETMTFIDFDDYGVCNYCKNHKKIELKNGEDLNLILSKYRRNDGRPDCIVPFSGGRDSSFGLYYIKKELGMHPVAYTYDWGVLTDLGRRNQARVCGKLGVEHIIISADIRSKRENVRRNIEAWLKRPDLGMIPLFMAGDKELLHHAEWLKKKLNVKTLIYSYGNGMEDDLFKIGFSGVKMEEVIPFQQLSLMNKLRIAGYYAGQYLTNPSYINRSLLDTIFAYYSVFILPDDNIHLFNYVQWNEDELLNVIEKELGWEGEADTKATWRIDDGTAALYNYIYMTVAGFTEFDNFRSAQIREGHLTRERALELIKEENKPRFDSLEWYAKIIGFDINRAIKIINSMPKHY